MINSGFPPATLVWAWEIYGASLHDFALRIPESGGKVPDFLAEVQWNLQWTLSLHAHHGGVRQKQSRDDFCSFIMPQDELGPNYVIGTGSVPYKSTCATADLADVMAIAARCYSSYAPAFSQQCLKAARAAWSWCQNNPNVFFQESCWHPYRGIWRQRLPRRTSVGNSRAMAHNGRCGFPSGFHGDAAAAISDNKDRATFGYSSSLSWILELCAGRQK